MEWYYSQYLPDRRVAAEPEASPILAKLEGVAPATIVTAGFDPLRDEGREFALRLQKAGVSVEYVELPGMIHGFIGLYGFVDAARRCLTKCSEILGAALREDSARADLVGYASVELRCERTDRWT